MGVHRTCREPNEIDLTPIGVELNGSRCVPACQNRNSLTPANALRTGKRKSRNILRVGVFFLISLGSPHVRCTSMGRTRGEPNEIELNPIGVELNGWGGVHVQEHLLVHVRVADRRAARWVPVTVAVRRAITHERRSIRFRLLASPCTPQKGCIVREGKRTST